MNILDALDNAYRVMTANTSQTVCPTCKATRWEHNDWQWDHCLEVFLKNSEPSTKQ